ncbi:histidine kinase [Streptomyces sp. NPDC091217]|uniref:histidine kinase n=1 Tax=Streptomyces sp. NPDC091217 TaxID=3365975 RepID=UPI003817FF4A
MQRVEPQAGDEAGTHPASTANVGLGLLMATALALDLRTLAQTRAGGQWSLDLAVGTAVGVAALLRGRLPTACAVAGLTVYGTAALVAGRRQLWPVSLFGAALVGLVVLAVSSARTLPARRAVAVGALGALVTAGAGVAHTSYAPVARAALALTGITVWGAALAAGVWLRHLDHRERLTVEAVRREERLELARELHDVVAHHVTGILVQAQAARFTAAQHPEAAADALSDIETVGGETLAALRRLVGLLREPGDTTGHAAPESIDQLVRRFSATTAPVELRAPADLDTASWPPEIAGTTYRVVQEALTNIARHAPDATAIAVTITSTTGQLTIDVTNEASATRARPPRTGGGYGLIGMRERVEALGGVLRSGPRGHAGWAISASLPLPETARP